MKIFIFLRNNDPTYCWLTRRLFFDNFTHCIQHQRIVTYFVRGSITVWLTSCLLVCSQLLCSYQIRNIFPISLDPNQSNSRSVVCTVILPLQVSECYLPPQLIKKSLTAKSCNPFSNTFLSIKKFLFILSYKYSKADEWARCLTNLHNKDTFIGDTRGSILSNW